VLNLVQRQEDRQSGYWTRTDGLRELRPAEAKLDLFVKEQT